MSGGHYRKNRLKYFLLRKIHSGGKVEFEEKVSSLTSSTSKDPLLIPKPDGPKVQGQSHPTDRIIKNIQIQTGSGKAETSSAIEKTTKEEEEDSDSSSTSGSSCSNSSCSSISLDFEDEVSKAEVKERSKKRKEAINEAEAKSSKVEAEEENPLKKFKTYDFNLID